MHVCLLTRHIRLRSENAWMSLHSPRSTAFDKRLGVTHDPQIPWEHVPFPPPPCDSVRRTPPCLLTHHVRLRSPSASISPHSPSMIAFAERLRVTHDPKSTFHVHHLCFSSFNTCDCIWQTPLCLLIHHVRLCSANASISPHSTRTIAFGERLRGSSPTTYNCVRRMPPFLLAQHVQLRLANASVPPHLATHMIAFAERLRFSQPECRGNTFYLPTDDAVGMCVRYPSITTITPLRPQNAGSSWCKTPQGKRSTIEEAQKSHPIDINPRTQILNDYQCINAALRCGSRGVLVSRRAFDECSPV
jgi:hypothetical protein